MVREGGRGEGGGKKEKGKKGRGYLAPPLDITSFYFFILAVLSLQHQLFSIQFISIFQTSKIHNLEVLLLLALLHHSVINLRNLHSVLQGLKNNLHKPQQYSGTDQHLKIQVHVNNCHCYYHCYNQVATVGSLSANPSHLAQ